MGAKLETFPKLPTLPRGARFARGCLVPQGGWGGWGRFPGWLYTRARGPASFLPAFPLGDADPAPAHNPVGLVVLEASGLHSVGEGLRRARVLALRGAPLLVGTEQLAAACM